VHSTSQYRIERRLLIREFYETLHDKIRKSERVAYRHYDEHRSYAEMYDFMRRLNSMLAGRKRRRVAIHAEKSFANYASIFAVILSNNTWVPINPDLPNKRNAEMLLLARPDLILTDRALSPELSSTIEEIGTQLVFLDEVMRLPSGPEFEFSKFDKDDLSMIYFTSGSTGKPKGVPLTHENYILNVRNILNIVDLKSGEVFADYHDLAFVISVPILFPCVMCEGALAPAIDKRDMMLPMENMRENEVSVLISVPSTMARIRKMRQDGLKEPHLSLVIMCGEPLHLDILDYILSKLQVDQVYDFYGSTEVAPWIFCHECSAEDLSRFKAFGVIPIGMPIEGNSVRVDENDELWVAGPQITPGYLGSEGKNRFVELEGARWYRTGDKVVVHDGHYLCKGRLDSQVKIGGYRIELMDTEAHLRSMDGVDAAICFVEGEGARKSIVAGLHSTREIGLAEVRSHLKNLLPSYMLPRKTFVLKELPLNKSGKIDRFTVRANYEDGIS
tara:strand:+ start:4862 stop:6367 length:1506 start_codon:yes stop_codon:yes gene_type:complete